MEDIARMVNESLADHGYEPKLDHRRLQWSKWFRCDSSFSVLLAPCQPGIFALGEEIVSPGEAGSKRMLALFYIGEAADISYALGNLFLPGSPMRARLESGHCFTRYAIIETAAERTQAVSALQQWMQSSAELPQVA
jgi:hypothetical protein